MTRKDRARKRRLATLHTKGQQARKKAALRVAEHDARCTGKNGRPLKKERTGDAYRKALVEAMAAMEYVPTGKGGWRKLHTRKTAKQDGMSREAMANG